MPKGRSGIITEEFKGKENTAYHDVEKLFKIYRSVNWKMQIKINQVKRHFQLEYGTDVDKFLDSLYQAGMDVDMDLASEKERVESINHSNKFLKLMDESVDLMRKYHPQGERYYWVLYYEFNSGIDVLDTIPGENDEVIEFGGKYYRTTNRRISYMEDKTEDDRYYILTLIAIAKELDTMKKEAVLAPNELIEIELLVGLPPAHYGKYRKKFQQYFQRDGKVVGFKYGGTSYQILIHEVKVYVQAYAAYCVLAARRHLTELPKVLVIDIGGFTVDYMILRYGRLEKEHVDSLESGVICLYGRIRAAIRQKYSIALDEEDIDNIILGKNTGYMQELKERVREVTIGYVTELLGTFRELGIDFRTTQTVFMGGGAILVSEIIKVVWERFKGEYFIINDPKANAKGYKLQFQIEAKERED